MLELAITLEVFFDSDYVSHIPGSVYTSKKSPAAIEKFELFCSDNSHGLTSGNVIGRVWSSFERLLQC